MTNQIHELLIICIGRTVAPLYVRVQCVLNGGDDSSSIIRVVEELRPILLGFFFFIQRILFVFVRISPQQQNRTLVSHGLHV